MVIETFSTSSETRAILREFVKANFYDPFTIKDAAISNSWRTDRNFALVGNRHVVVCARFNTKNRAGAYMGRMYAAFVIIDDKIAEVEYGAPNCFDPMRVKTWGPFPEIMNIT